MIGCDDIAEAAASFPGLTTVRGSHVDMVHRALDLLNERMANPTMEQKRVIMAPTLVVRGTTARLAG